ncbi:MAG: hypothetical protein M3384_19015 [Acidobacteriota bacterium]|nr:hypothetical protein [Acidobacteriota bacterium]
MRNLRGVTIAVLTFFLGVSLYFIFLNFVIEKSKPLVKLPGYSSLPARSLCEVTGNHKLFGNHVVRIRAYLTGRDNYGYEVRDPKGNCDYAEAHVEFWLEEETKAETEKLFQEITARYAEGAMTFAEVEMVGELIDYYQLGQRPFGGRFSIEAKEIKQISPVTQISYSEWDKLDSR